MTTSTPLPPEAPAKPRKCGLAIASLILGIVGPCTVGLASIAGLILSIAGLAKIKRSAGQLGGRNMAIAGLIISAVGVVIAPLLLMAILMPAVFGALNQANAASSANSVSVLCKVSMSYASRHNSTYPPGDTWPEIFRGMGITDATLANLADRTAGRGYAINAAVAGKPQSLVRQPSETVLFFECAPGAPPAGGPDALPTKPRFGREHHIGFCDGHVERIPIEELGRLIWNPEEEQPKE